MDYAALKAGIVNPRRWAAPDRRSTPQNRGGRVAPRRQNPGSTAGVALCPVWTPLIPATTPPDQEEFGQQVPMGRVGQPAELAPALCCSPPTRPATSPRPGSW